MLRKGIPGITAGDAARTLRERCAGEKNLPVGPGGQRVRRGAGRAELGARREAGRGAGRAKLDARREAMGCCAKQAGVERARSRVGREKRGVRLGWMAGFGLG